MIGINYYQLDTHLSKWCILERFKRIFHLYETSKVNCSVMFEELYQVNLSKRTDGIYKELFGDFLYSTPYHQTLRYCPLCLSRGIHLYEHQSLVFTHCLLHPHQPLLTTCLKCHSVIQLPYQSARKREPFSCQCGHCFLKDNTLNILLFYWQQELLSARNDNAFKKTDWNVFPRAVSKVSTKSLSILYSASSDFPFNITLEKTFSRRLLDEDKFHFYRNRDEVIECSCQNFLSRLLSGKIISENHLRLFIRYIIQTDDIYDDEISYFLNTRKNYQKLVKSLYRSTTLSECYYDFLWNMIIDTSINGAHYIAQNWLIYHFIQYLYSEIIRRITTKDDSWQPFLYHIDYSEEMRQVHIKIQYHTIETMVK